eukprot:527738-Hanusia_phi.AAC.1
MGAASLRPSGDEEEENDAEGLDRLNLGLDLQAIGQGCHADARVEGADLCQAHLRADAGHAEGVGEGADEEHLAVDGEEAEEPGEDELVEEDEDDHDGDQFPDDDADHLPDGRRILNRLVEA